MKMLSKFNDRVTLSIIYGFIKLQIEIAARIFVYFGVADLLLMHDLTKYIVLDNLISILLISIMWCGALPLAEFLSDLNKDKVKQ